jgi:hypothetical protein
VALQISHQYPAIFHAITATGTMARALTVLIHPTFPRPILHELTNGAVRQYEKAIKVLRQHVDRAVSASTAIEPILLACLLCVCFESFRGRKSAAIYHARLGWKILQDKSTNLDTKSSPSVSFFNTIFPQHAGAHALFDDKEHHDSDCCMEDLSLPSHTFSSVEEATNQLARIAKHSEHFRMELLQLAKAPVVQITRIHGLNDESSFCLATCLSRTIEISNLHRSRFEQLKMAHVQWKSAYTPHKAGFVEEDPEGTLILRIQYFYSMFALATCRDSEERLSDRFMDDFEDALDSVEQYLAVADRRSSGMQNSSTDEQPNQSMFFGFSMLPTLHLIAHKCRDSLLRRRALHLLFTAQKQEGLEYSGALGMYAASTMETEEHRALLLAQQIPEWDGQSLQPVLPEQARIADCVVTGQGARGIYKLTCARYLHERSGLQQIELTQYEGGAVPLRLCSSWVLAV